MNLKKIKDSSEFTIIEELNSLLAEEFQAWYQYFIVRPFLVGSSRLDVEDFFKEASEDELDDHAVKLIERISELSDTTVLSTPESWKDVAKSKFLSAPLDVVSQLKINIEAEQDAINHYTTVIELAEGVKDFVTADILKKILADEEEHLTKLTKLLNDTF